MSTGFIIWPEEPQEAVRLYLKFVLQSLELCDFKNKDGLKESMDKAAQFIRGELTLDELNANAKPWWDFLWDEKRLRDFRSNDTLIARLAVCIVDVKESQVHELGDLVSWYLEVLHFLRVDSKPVMQHLKSFFKYSC